LALDFDNLKEEYSGADKIPNALLYEYLEQERENIIALMQVENIPASKLGQEVRRRSKSDLMWLARYFTWCTNPVGVGRPISENQIDEQYYRPVINLFVQKDDSKSISQQSSVKTRLLLWPRGGMKSTIDHVDTVQWILNFPDIRILYLTAEVSLAEGFVGEVKGHFLIKEDEPSWMNIFFPEFCVEENKAGAKFRFTCPIYAAKKTGRKEPTVYASSVGKTKSGWHYELIKADDGVSDVNSITSAQCQTVSKHLFLAEKLLALGGYYIDYVGTRYDDLDHYGVMLDQNLGDITRTTGPGWEFTENRTTGINILVGKAIQIKPEVAEQLEKEGRPVTYQEAGADGCILLLPHIMPFSWCMMDLAKDEKSFEGQRNQNPRVASTVEFTRILLLKNTIPYAEMPMVGPVSQVWDFAFSKKKGRDYSTGCSIMWGENADKEAVGYVQEVVRDRFNHHTLAKAVVDLAVRGRPFIIGIENAGGSQFLESAIIYEATKTRDQQIIDVCSRIDWFPVDNQNEAKKTRMRALYPWLLRGGLKFANYCMSPNLEILYSEFEKCLASHHHDDIPDVISQQFRLYAPKAYQVFVSGNEEMFSSKDSAWNLIYEDNCDPFGRIGFGPPVPTLEQEIIEEPEIRAESYNGLPNYLGAGNWG